jgi:hypothetical protein
VGDREKKAFGGCSDPVIIFLRMPAPFFLSVLLSAAAGPLFTEVQADPGSGVPEWVEIDGRGGQDLSGWTLDDGTTFRKLPDGTSLPEGGILVLSRDCVALRGAWSGASIPCATAMGWNSLSVDSDAVVLRDLSGNAADSVRWNHRTWGDWPAGRSRERISLQDPSCDPANWVASTLPGGTPGWIPAVVSPGFAALAMAPERRAVAPGKDNRIDLSAPAGQRVVLELYDLSRRRIALLWNASAPPEGWVSWDARAGNRNLPPGLYVLLARCGGDSRKAWVAVEKP